MKTSRSLSLMRIVVIAALVCLFSTAVQAAEPVRPSFAADIGPFVTMHYLDHKAINNYVGKFGMSKFDEMTLGGGLGSRILVGPVQLSSHLEGWSASTSGKGSDAGMWGLNLGARLGFTLVRRTFLSILYFGSGLDYAELNINGKDPLPDFSGWKLGLPGDVGLTFEYLFPIASVRNIETSEERTNIPIGVSIGYSGEIISDPYYERTGQLADGVRDRFMGWYLRFDLRFGGGSYSRDGRFMPDADELWPRGRDRKPPENDEKPAPEKEKPAPEDDGDRADESA